tara:strand:- start:3331 stop:4137 length:807 start_codon:yes stop_codon:yes gene_type:complete
MKVKGLDGKDGSEVKLPSQFSEAFRPDMIKRAVLSIQSHKRQAYGAQPGAGMRASATLSKRRKSYKTCYDKGIARTPRKILSARGLNFYWVGAVAPNTVSGRRAHPPKAEKVWDLKMNRKERRLAIRSAIAATVDAEMVKNRGHKAESVVVDTKFEELKRTKEVKDLFLKLGLEKELKRISVRKVRAGKGKIRNRRYRVKKGPLIVVSKKCALADSARNFMGVDVCMVKDLNAELLAPGTHAGRLTLWSQGALDVLGKENLFYERREK